MKWLHRDALATWLVGAALALVAGAAPAQEAAVVKRATQLRDSPADNGASVAPLEANTVVTRSSERKGPWTKVSTPQGATGWVHMFDLGPQSGAAAASNNTATGGLRGLGGLFGGNSGTTTTATGKGDGIGEALGVGTDLDPFLVLGIGGLTLDALELQEHIGGGLGRHGADRGQGPREHRTGQTANQPGLGISGIGHRTS